MKTRKRESATIKTLRHLWWDIKMWGRKLGASKLGFGNARNINLDEMPGEMGKAGLGLSTLLGLLDWDQINAEVLRESRAQIVVAGAAGCGKSALLNYLRGAQTASNSLSADLAESANDESDGLDEPIRDERIVEDLGLFVVATAPESGGQALQDWFPADNSDLIVWVLDGAVGLRTWEYEWLCRVRATGRPLILALNKVDVLADAAQVARLTQQLGYPLVPVSAKTGQGVVDALLPAMVAACPTLTTALGREVPAWRSMAVQNAAQRAALLSGLAGVEPVPLLDLPFQMLIQLRLVLRVAAAYGEPIGDRYSRELLATLVGGAGLRYVGQQLAKLVPLVGWVASGALAAAGTFAIGKLAAAYFENGRRLPRPHLNGKAPRTASNGLTRNWLKWRKKPKAEQV